MAAHSASGAHGPAPDRLRRRIAERQRQLGVSDAVLAKRARMSPHYLRQLAAVGLDFDPDGLRRVAAALGMTFQDLIDDRTDIPPGQPGPGERPVLIRLTGTECWDRVGPHGVGRVVLPAEPAPVAYPVNYAVDAETVVYRTAREGEAAPGEGTVVSFEVDRIDEETSQGWSVLLTGQAERVGAAESRHLAEEELIRPWAGGDRPQWVRIHPDRVTGRRIGAL
ncbi:pyridoxamine 5'-phosphate oxidase family protein [Actinacidiphila sp. bgisy145]|uniref:pyridoxamine 5'-phosphate oxidase family protein n=1 Tax=Actinacidiphila sp. bgisy145 TaxID=3413792 RepID=UPI003EBCFDDB